MRVRELFSIELISGAGGAFFNSFLYQEPCHD